MTEQLHPEAIETDITTPSKDTICDPRFWRRRLREAERAGQLHFSVFKCPLDRWQRIEQKHGRILRGYVKIDTDILDAGCGWGRLANLLPEWWRGHYVGVDIAPAFIEKAERDWEAKDHWPQIQFFQWDLRAPLTFFPGHDRKVFDLAIFTSMKHMILRHRGEDDWNKMHANVARVSERILYLEYDEDDPGTLEEL